MKCTIKALNPVYRAYVATIISAIQGIPGILSAGLDSGNQYDFIFTIEYAAEEELPGIMMHIKSLLQLYGSTILDVTQY